MNQQVNKANSAQAYREKQQLKADTINIVAEYLKSTAFVDRKVTDTPTDALQVVNRRYVTNNGTVASRPVSSAAAIGQPYFATDTGIPMTYSAQGWRNGVGSIVALNN